MRLYEVGGCVRDEILGVPTKDIDYAVEIQSLLMTPSEAFDCMVGILKRKGYTIWMTVPESYTLRAKFPNDHIQRNLTADFVMCRREGPYSDGRHPDWVKLGKLEHDLARRDFTINAIAKDELGGLIDPFNGLGDIHARIIRFVGDPMQRLQEDGLRSLRALRFSVTKGMQLAATTRDAIEGSDAANMLRGVSAERIREELHKMFMFDTMRSLQVINGLPQEFRDVLFTDAGIRLRPTMEK